LILKPIFKVYGAFTHAKIKESVDIFEYFGRKCSFGDIWTARHNQ